MSLGTNGDPGPNKKGGKPISPLQPLFPIMERKYESKNSQHKERPQVYPSRLVDKGIYIPVYIKAKW